VGFLDQLKSQASALQSEKTELQANLAANAQQTEAACRSVLGYFNELAKQLNVLAPSGPAFTLDGKTPWPETVLSDFRVDARRKTLRDKEVFDYIGMGWQILPRAGAPVTGSVSVNFPPDLQRVESRIAIGMLRHERKEIRLPEKNALQAIVFDYEVESRGSVTVTPDHDSASVSFRVVNASGFAVQTAVWPAGKIKTDVLDELAKLIVAQPSSFA
jgi:hypothetical protein